MTKTKTKTKTKVTVPEALLKEVKEAYADCWLPFEEGEKRRNLDFRASTDCSPAEAFAILKKAIPGGYNEFTASLLKKFDEGCRITIAREGSVCLYVKGTPPSREELKADEWDEVGKEVRIWWD